VLLNRALAVTALLLATTACEGGTTTSPIVPGTSSTTEVISYGDNGVMMRKPADVAKLTGAPDDFKHFMSGVIDASVQNSVPEDECTVTVRVDAIHPRGFAAGGITSCGGYVAIWKRVGGVWRQVWGGQDYPECSDLRRSAVPPELLANFIEPDSEAKCYDPNRNDVVPYRP
jgi:hypothetical protein